MNSIPVLSPDDVHVWRVHVPLLLDALSTYHGLLSADEQERAARFRRLEDRERSILSRGVLRRMLGEYVHLSPEKICFTYTEQGKPEASLDYEGAPLSFNVSHAGEWIFLAFGAGRLVGVDVEQHRSKKSLLGIAERFFAPAEVAFVKAATDQCRSFYAVWTRKEAYVKACGIGISYGLDRFSVPIEQGALPDRAVRDGWVFCGLEADEKYSAALVSDKALSHIKIFDVGDLKWEC